MPETANHNGPTRTISACLIVKDESANLPRCLASLKGLVDEIVVVDTGSTDDTVAIAESYGAKVSHFAWCDDFSAARNASMERATGDWLLIIDADEELVVEDRQAWQRTLESTPCHGFMLDVANMADGGRIDTRTPNARIFLNHEKLRYDGRIHNDIMTAFNKLGFELGMMPGGMLRHYGYTAEAMRKGDKVERTLRLSKLVAEERPDDPVSWYNLVRTYWVAQDMEGASEAMKQLRRMWGQGSSLDPYRLQNVLTIEVWLHLLAGRNEEAEAVLEEGIAQFPGFPEFHYERGRLRMQVGDWAGAEADLSRCLAARGQTFMNVVREGVTGYQSHLHLAKIKAQLGRLDEARDSLEAALADPACPEEEARQARALLGKLPASPQAAPLSTAPSISACLIVRDESANLPRCLASLKGLVDEIVVVDTGSTDDTVAIAESYGAKVSYFEWNDSFSDARNASMDRATGDWLFIIDADEELVVEDPQAFRSALQSAEISAWLVEILNTAGPGSAQIESRFAAVRCVRRHADVHFTGRLHEDLSPALARAGWQPVLCGIAHIRHHGYAADVLAQPEKKARNSHLALKLVEDAPEDPTAWYHLARTCWLAEDGPGAAGAIEQVKRLAEQGKALDKLRLQTFKLLEAWVYKALDDVTQAAAALEEGLAFYPGFPEYHYERGLLRVKAGDRAGAQADFEACLAASGKPQPTIVREGVAGYLARLELAALAAEEGDMGRAAHQIDQALQDPACPKEERQRLKGMRDVLGLSNDQLDVSFDGAITLLESGRLEEAKASLLRLLEGEPRLAVGFLALGQIFYLQGELDKALLALGQAINLDAGLASAYNLVAQVLESLGQPKWAERFFAAVLQLSPDHPSALEARLACRRKQPEYELAADEAAQLESLLALIRRRVSACLIVKNESENLPRCLASLQGLMDEIVVVDTGSTDDTVAIAESYGAKVSYFEWNDSFSDARNASMDRATGDWLFIIDADEELRVEDRQAFRRAILSVQDDAYTVEVLNMGDQNEVGTRAMQPRFFRAIPNLRYEGRIHNDIMPSFHELGLRLGVLPEVEMRHYGYTKEAMDKRKKIERTLRLTQRVLDERPDDPISWYNMIRTYWLAEDMEKASEAITELRRLRKAGKELDPFRLQNILLIETAIHFSCNRLDAAREVLDEGIKRYPGFPDYHYERGRLRAFHGDLDGARADFEACLASHGKPFMTIGREGLTSYMGRAQLAEVYARQGDSRRALRYLIEASEDPACPQERAEDYRRKAEALAGVAAGRVNG